MLMSLSIGIVVYELFFHYYMHYLFFSSFHFTHVCTLTHYIIFYIFVSLSIHVYSTRIVFTSLLNCNLYSMFVCTLIPREGVERVNKILQILQITEKQAKKKREFV